MKAYIIHQSDLGTNYWGEGVYALITEKEEVIFKRWCTNRAFACFDLTNGIQEMLEEKGITDVWSNGELIWVDGLLTYAAYAAFRAANYEYELENSDAI